MTSHTHPEVSRQTSRGESHLKYSFDLDVDYITERLIAVSFPAGGLEAQYCSNLHEVVGMLKNRHQDKYVIFNLSQRRHDLAQLGSQVYDLGWPDHLAPSLEKLCSICKHIETWFKQDPHHVVVLHCKGGRAPIGVIVLAYMNYISITSSAETGMDRYAMKRFLDAKTESAMQPSQHRYVNYFTGLLNKSIHVNSAPLFLHHVLIHGVPNYDIHGGCRPFLRIYQGMQHIHTSGVYTVPEGTSQFVISLEQALPIRGDILVKCYHKRSHATSRDVIFRCQFHTTAIVECRLVFQKADLDDAVTDGRFPTFTKVELVFSHTPDQLHGSDYVAGSNFPVDESYDPLVRWDSYEHFDKVVKGGDSSPDVIGLSGNINNNIPHRSAPDGSLYAEVQKTPSPIQPDKRFFSTPSQAAPISPMSSQLTPQMASAEDFKMAPLSSMQTTQMAVLRAKRNVQMDPGYQTTKARSPSPRTPTSDPPSPLLPTAPVPPASNGPQRPTDLLNGPKSTDSASTKRRPMNYKEQRELDDLLRGIGDDAPAINSPGSIASGQEIVDERKIVDVQAQMSQLPRMDPSYSSTPKTYPSQHPSGPREPENPYAEITDTTPKRNMAPLQFPERSNATVEEAITPTRVEKVEAFPAPSLNEQRTPQLHDNPTYAVTKNERSLPHRGMERTQDTVDSGDTKVMVQQANPHQADTWQPQPLRAKKEQILFIYKEDPTSPRGPQGSPAGTQGTPAVPQVSPAGLQGSPAVPQVSPAGPQVSLAGLQGSPAGIQGSPAGPQVSLAGLQGSPAGLQGTQAGSQVSPRGTDSAPRVTESTARQPQPPEQPTKQPDSRESTEIGDDAMTWLQRQQQKLKEKRQREGGPPPPVFQTARRESQPEQYQAQYMSAPPSAPSHERAQTAVPQHMPASREEPSTDAPTWLQQKQKKLELKRGQAEASTPLFIDTSHQKPSHNVAPSSTRLDNRGLNRSPPKQLHLSDLDKSVNQCPDGQSSHPPTAYGPITPPNTYEHETNPLRAESWQSHQRALSRQMSDITHDREKAASQRHPDPQPASHAAMGDALTSLPPAGPSLSTSYKESAGPQALPQTSKDTMKDAQDNANLHIDEASIEEPLNLEGRVADRIANFTSKMGDQPKSPPATGPRVSPAKAKPVTRRTPHQSGYDSDTAIQQYYDSPSPRPTAGTPERWLQNPGGLPVQESEYWSRSEGLKSPNPREQWARKPEYDVASSNESLHNGSVTPRFPVGPKAYKNMVSTPIAIVGRPPHAPDAPYPLSPIRRDDRDVLDTSGLHISPSQQMAMPNTAEPLSVESPASTAAHAKSPPTPEVITVTHRRIVQTERFFNQNGPQETPSAAMVGAIEALPQQQQQPQREELPQQPQSQALQQHVQPQMQQQSPQQWQQLPQQPPPSQQQHLLQQQQQLPQKQQQLPQKQQQLPQQQMPQQQLPQQQLPQQQLPQQQLPQQQLPQQQLPQQQLPKQQLPQQQLPQQQLPQQQLPQQQLPQQQLPQQQLPQQQLPQQQLPQQQLPQQQLPQQQPPQPILGKVERVATPTGPVEFNSEKNLVENGQHYPVEAKMERVPITKYSLQEKQDVAGKPSGQQYSSYGVTTTKKEVTFQDARGGVPERPTSPQALAGTNAQQVGQVPVEENVVPTVKKPVEAAPTWPIELEVRIKNEGMGPAIGDVQVQGAAAASNSPQQVSPNAQAWTASRQEPVIVVEKIQEDHVEPEHSSHMMNLASQPPPPQYPTYSDRMKNRPPGPLYPTFSDRHRKAGAGRLEEVSPNVANGYHTMYDNRGAGKTKRASTGSDGMWSAQSGHHRMPSDGGLGPPASGRTTPSNFYLMQHPSPYSSSMSLADTSVDKVRFVKDLSAWWYKPHISRDEAIGMLKDKSPGQFVVRDSNSFPGAFGLAVKVAQLPPNTPPSKKVTDPANELVRHFLIEPNPRGVRLKGCANEPIFGSLSALIYQHTLTQLALPCKLQLPESDPCGVDTTDSAIDPKSAHALLSQGAACNVQYLGTMEMESLTGSSAVSEATRRLFKLKEKPKRVLVHFKVSLKGITLTDNHRKLFFRRHYPVESVLYCGTDSGSRKWKRKDGNDESLAKIFGFVNRKPGSKTDNQCHLFAEYELEQPASAIVSFVTKVLLGSAVHS